MTITKTDGVGSYTPGGTVVYTIVIGNDGPSAVVGAAVRDVNVGSPQVTGASWECAAAGGATCTAGPVVGDISDTVNLPVGGTATYTLTVDLDPSASGDLILYTDADLPFDMSELARAVRLMRDYDVDIVSAYRFDRTGEGYTRRLYTIVYNLLIRTMFGVLARDINFAFKLCRARIFEHVELKSEGSFIDAELVIRATRLGYEMLQFGVDYFPRTRGESTLSSPGVILTILKEMRELRGDLEEIEPLDLDG